MQHFIDGEKLELRQNQASPIIDTVESHWLERLES